MKRTTILLALLIIFLLSTSSALAMSSTNYKLDWFVPLTGGGGPAASANYAVNFTVGQTAIGAATITNYGLGLGYWYGVMIRNIFLPLIMR